MITVLVGNLVWLKLDSIFKMRDLSEELCALAQAYIVKPNFTAPTRLPWRPGT
jgi:hypothetical protein